jgi:hypothetical protein
MTVRTIDDIVLEGCLKAGDEGVRTRVHGYFNDWLGRQARSWPWPSLTYPLQITAPAGSWLLQSTDGNIDLGISRILDECWLYTTDKKHRTRLRIRNAGHMADIEPPADAVGVPTFVGIIKRNSVVVPPSDPVDLWGFAFDTHLDKDRLFVTSVCIIPEVLAPGATELPWYPEDDTCIQACMTEALLYKNGPDDPSYQSALEVLASMVQADRVRHGSSPSVNRTWELDRSVFR